MEVCILAGGLSTRMGRDKARLKLGGRTLIAAVRAVAVGLGSRVRVIRRDLVARCGPLGGVFTALKTAHSPAVLFLACDAPFVSPVFLRRLVRLSTWGTRAAFVIHDARVGFPFILPIGELSTVEAMIARREFSLQQLADAVAAKRLRASPRDAAALFNVNTPEDWARAQAWWRTQRATGSSGSSASRWTNRVTRC